MSENKRSLLKNFSVVALIAIFSKIFGFLRDAIISFAYGASNVTDAFNIVQFLPNFFFMVVNQAIAVGFIPIFLSIRKKSISESNSFVTLLFATLTAISSIFCAFLYFFPHFWIQLFATGFSEETTLLAVQMLQLTSWSLLLQSFVLVFASYLNALKKFIIPACLGFVLDASIICFLGLSKCFDDPSLLGFAPLANMVLQSVILWFASRKNGFKPNFHFAGNGKNFKEMLRIAFPSIIALGISQINYYVDKNISSNYEVGSISALSLSSNVVNALENVIVLSLATVLYTEFSKMESSSKNEDALKLLSKTCQKLVNVLIPLSLFMFVASGPIVKLLYGHGSFSSENVALTANCCRYYSLGIPFIGLTLIIVRFFYSIKKVNYVAISSALGLCFNIIGDILVWKFTDFDASALSAVTAGSFFINCLCLLFFLIREAKVKQPLLDYSFMFVSYGFSFIACLFAYFPIKYLNFSYFGIPAIFTGFFCFGVVYCLLLLFYAKKTMGDSFNLVCLWRSALQKIKKRSKKK